jgi:hypothetical protein
VRPLNFTVRHPPLNRTRWVRLALVASVAAVGILIYASNPLLLPDGAVHKWLLWEVPPGATVEDLKRIAHARGWRIQNSWRGDQPGAAWAGISGATVVEIYLGGYRILFRTDLDSFWAFDSSGHLIDVRTRRMTDAL